MVLVYTNRVEYMLITVAERHKVTTNVRENYIYAMA